MSARVRAAAPIADALRDLERGLVFVARDVGDGWDDVLAELTEAFEATRQAFDDGMPVVYVVRAGDLLGRNGAGRAMVAAGLLSGARTAAIEGRRSGIPVNVLAVEEDPDVEVVALWCRRLLEAGGPTGELIHLGGSQIGKALA